MLAQIESQFLLEAAKAGVLALFCAWLLWRDGKRTDQQQQLDALRIAAQDARTDRQEQQLQRILGALQDLIHSLSLEVLTRPNLLERTRQEAQENLEKTKRGDGTR